ncbi:MAG: hypothetical protein IKH04_02065 [Kiritimatiellae bacterium]|nr:hypothetical protein [Kiritimatiellia bacterium]
MPLNVTPNVNIDTLRNLDANKTYFLSSTTGRVKEASIWMRFKCAIGVQSARQKVSNLADAVRATLLDAVGQRSDTGLEADIRTMDIGHMLKGSAIKNIVNRFSVANAGTMAKADATAIAKAISGPFAAKLAARHIGIGDSQAIASIFMHAFKPVLDGELPMKKGPDGHQVLDKAEVEMKLSEVARSVESLLHDVAMSDNLRGLHIDSHYARHIIMVLFREDGTRSEDGMSDLMPPDEAFAASLYNLDKHNATQNSFVHDELVSHGRDPIAYAKNIREMCGGDKELEAIVELGLRSICGTGANELRPDDVVAKKIADLRDNLAEAREVEKRFPGFMPEFMEAMYDLAGTAMPKGSIARMAEGVARADVSKISKLNSFSGPGAILEAIDQLRTVTNELGNPYQVFADKQDDIIAGGAMYGAPRRIVQALALAKAGPSARARIANAMHGTASREALFILERRQFEAKSPNLYHGREKDLRKNLFENEIETLNEFYHLFQSHENAPEDIDSKGITWEQAIEDNDFDFDPMFDAHVAKALEAEQAAGH